MPLTLTVKFAYQTISHSRQERRQASTLSFSLPLSLFLSLLFSVLAFLEKVNICNFAHICESKLTKSDTNAESSNRLK